MTASWQSRVFAILVMSVAAAMIADCSGVASFTLNVPTYFGDFDRRVDVAYGPGNRQRLDIYAPRQRCNRPVVVFWYGGMWIYGEKSAYRFVGAALARAGYIAVLPDYRLYPQVRFPSFIEDGASAVRWTREHIDEYGGNPDAIFLMGHSAGAYIASNVALDDRYLHAHEARSIKGFIGLSGPYALDSDDPATSGGRCFGNPYCVGLLARIFAAPDTPQNWRPGPAAVSARVPTLLLHGQQDGMVPVQDAELLRDRVQAVGGTAEVHAYDTGSHEGTVLSFVLPSLATAPVMRDVSHFIDRHSPTGSTGCSDTRSASTRLP